MRTIIWFCWFWGQLVALMPMLHKANRAMKQGDDKTVDEMVQKMVPMWAGGLLKLAGVTVEVKGKEHIPQNQAVVFVANHRSYYDIPLMLTSLDKPHPLVAKKEIGSIPIVRGWMRLLRCVFLDRENPRKAMEAMNQAMENLRKGYSVTIFPEGTRSKGSELDLGEFKAGAFRIATKTKSPIVPVAIHGSRDIMENNGGWMKPAHITIEIMPAVDTAELTREEIKQLPNQIQEKIHSQLTKMQ